MTRFDRRHPATTLRNVAASVRSAASFEGSVTFECSITFEDPSREGQRRPDHGGDAAIFVSQG